LRDNKDGLDNLSADPVRVCSNGELVRPMSEKPGMPIANAAGRTNHSVTIGIGIGGSSFAPASGVGGPPVTSGVSSGFAPAAASVPQTDRP
jgi:hypothetical protein